MLKALFGFKNLNCAAHSTLNSSQCGAAAVNNVYMFMGCNICQMWHFPGHSEEESVRVVV